MCLDGLPDAEREHGRKGKTFAVIPAGAAIRSQRETRVHLRDERLGALQVVYFGLAALIGVIDRFLTVHAEQAEVDAGQILGDIRWCHNRR